MIQKLILINSANFNFLEVNLEKDLFFLGDNGSGKTTAIRAIHYLFSGDVRNLGIPTDKDGFKEYYFKFANSYMIFVFEDFFIFMYKAGGEIVKIFSKQKFEMRRVMSPERTLYELSDIRKYAKTPNLHKTVRSLNEYREIIYGNNRKLLDFKFTSIKNNETFLGLFNEIFNIDKSIIDAKSIKKAVQTTLDYEKKVIDFNHEDYLQKIYTFKNEYKFFKEFEKQKSNIDDSYELKERLLTLEETIVTLREFMLYRVALEREELSKIAEKVLKIEKNLAKSKEYYKHTQNILTRCTKQFADKRNSLELEVRRVEALKEKFSQEKLLIEQDRADRYEEIQNRESELKESYIKLKSGFETELENIKKEITTLKYRRDKELQREFHDKKYNQIELLKDELEQKIEKENLAFEIVQSKSLLDESELREEIVVFEKAKESKGLSLANTREAHTQEIKRVRESYEKEEKKNRKIVKAKDDEIESKLRVIKNLELDKEDLQRVFNRETQENERSYKSELNIQEHEIQKYESIISAKPNSFKEYLNEEVDGWERELYPILDDILLDMSVEVLQPKLLSHTNLFGIEVQKQALKSIPTQQEAETKIASLNLGKENLESSYKESSLKYEVSYTKKQEAVQEKISFNLQAIVILKADIAEIRENIVKLFELLTEDREKLEKAFKLQEREFKNDMLSLQDEIKNNHTLIGGLHKELRVQKSKIQNFIEDIRDESKERVLDVSRKLELWLKDAQRKIDELIEIEEEKKFKITKDERVKELEKALGVVSRELQMSLLAKEFLLEYAACKQDIVLLVQKKSYLENIKLKNSEFQKRLELKIENYAYEKERLEEERKTQRLHDKNLQKGVDNFTLIESEVFEELTPNISDEYLYVLVADYNAIYSEYKSKKVDLKEKLDKLNILKNSQNEIEINFKFDSFDELFFISKMPHVISMIDDLFEFKNKKLEMVKSSGHNRFRSFVNSEIPTKMSIFNDGEDKFLSQVLKINKNLSSIDFGVIKDIRIETKIGEKKSIARLLNELNINVSNLSSLLSEESLFYDKDEVLVELNRLEMKFKEIKQELKGNAISLQDTIDLSLSFNENGKHISQVSQLKNESSTGGSMLLKIAIAVSILKLFIKEEITPFFLIVDEVSRLHSDNQEKLRAFANSKGFGIVFVTPEPTYSKPEAIKYYRFRKNSDDEFEAVELNL